MYLNVFIEACPIELIQVIIYTMKHNLIFLLILSDISHFITITTTRMTTTRMTTTSMRMVITRSAWTKARVIISTEIRLDLE